MQIRVQFWEKWSLALGVDRVLMDGLQLENLIRSVHRLTHTLSICSWRSKVRSPASTTRCAPRDRAAQVSTSLANLRLATQVLTWLTNFRLRSSTKLMRNWTNLKDWYQHLAEEQKWCQGWVSKSMSDWIKIGETVSGRKPTVIRRCRLPTLLK